MIEVLRKGMLTTVQDGGRHGYQHRGVPVCGAMDAHSLALANILAGNGQGEAALEITGTGCALIFHTPCAFAICGGRFDMTLDGNAIEMGRAYSAHKGATLDIGAAKSGFRGYVAFSGGLGVPLFLESRSTCLTGGFGGYMGRALENGDKIPLRGPIHWLRNMENRLAPLREMPQSAEARVVLGPQQGHFSAEGVEAFFTGSYIITADSNRMGYRTSGPKIGFAPGKGGNIISDGVAMGAVQVPGGLPIIMMADRQTIGGYAKIAHVISADLPVVAQLKPGDSIGFKAVGVEEAQELCRQRARALSALAYQLDSGWNAL